MLMLCFPVSLHFCHGIDLAIILIWFCLIELILPPFWHHCWPICIRQGSDRCYVPEERHAVQDGRVQQGSEGSHMGVVFCELAAYSPLTSTCSLCYCTQLFDYKTCWQTPMLLCGNRLSLEAVSLHGNVRKLLDPSLWCEGLVGVHRPRCGGDC